MVWGNKIKNIIDKTNKITKMTNRSIVLSFIMYVLVNCITLDAINNTVDIKMAFLGSRKIGMLIAEFLILIISHSINITLP